MFGLLNFDKPAGRSSRDVVNRVQRLVKPLKVGHAGTLDPLATGVLVVGIGQATRMVEYVQRMPKTYRAALLLGRASDTEDIEGNVVLLTDASIPSLDQLRAVLPRFVGTIEQVPPAFSALKVSGRRAYDLARRGQTVELAARPVEIYAIDLLDYAYPQLELRIRCGSGTYVRSLGRDLARAVGTDAVLSALRREAIGPFHAADAVVPDSLTLDVLQSRLLPPLLALGDMLRIIVSAEEVHRLVRGQPIAVRENQQSAERELAAVDSDGRLLAIVELRDDGLYPAKCFPTD